ncbi:MAG TPA: EDR1-related protein, partial [Pirellulales bacterium]|nr:EDR1-related protein [Pirellulales bacterium]
MNRCLVQYRKVFVLVLVALGARPVAGRDLVPAGGQTAWRYLDTGIAPDAAWQQPMFDDSRWPAGPAPLGFGEERLKTQVRPGVGEKQSTTIWFRHSFTPPALKPGESLVLMLCVDDGAVAYLNGTEIGRTNMPDGPITADTLARQTVGNTREGLYTRIHLPLQALSPEKKNVLAVEVHQASQRSSDLFFDLALKTSPAPNDGATLSSNGAEVATLFNRTHLVGPGVTIPDGYLDGGRGMKVDSAGQASSRREILVVDRTHDEELAADLAFARSAELRMLPELERVRAIAARIDQRTTPPGGGRWTGETVTMLEHEFAGKPVLIGDWVDQCQAGVCRHRALLFKLLADEAGLQASLTRGNFMKNGKGEAHAWNEVQLADGRRVLVDVMHNGGKPKFP